jgi:quercetin dioxygenase-like cupin family protein
VGIKHSAAGEVTRLIPPELDITAAKSAALVKTKDFEAIRLCLHAGQEIPAHKAEGPITVQCLAGRLVFTVDETPQEITAGDWLYLEGNQVHALKGLEDSVLLLTIMFV